MTNSGIDDTLPSSFFTEHRESAPAGVRLLALGTEHEQVAAFFDDAFPILSAAVKADYIAVVSSAHGEWAAVAEAGPRQPWPLPLLADVLDDEEGDGQPRAAGAWLAIAVDPKRAAGEIVLIHSPCSAPHVVVEVLARLFALSWRAVRQRNQQRLRVERLQAVLEVAGHWNQHQQVESLLTDMAQAAARLLDADRASIFLWDRGTRSLVARPALGVKNDELRIPDNAGIVGQVIHSGEPMRVDASRGQELINREVDTLLDYHTRTLLCVPLRSRRGEVLGAFETINKRHGAFTEEDLATLIELAAQASVALENTRERQALLVSRQLNAQAVSGAQLIGHSPAIEALRATIRRVAATDLVVMVLGENGTGKEVVSQSIHYLSRRREQPFVAINCASLSESLLESELFGHEKGAFTDAHESRAGKFELASGGTLFLDEIGDLSQGGQSKLLRVLEEKLVVRVGGSKPIHTDARVIAATNQDLAAMVGDKKFRQDLYFRLNVVTLHIPPLRERIEDIQLLTEYFLDDFCKKARRAPQQLSEAARARLLAHSWPGNVRELRNVMERLAYLSPSEVIEADDPALMFLPIGGQQVPIAGEQPLADATDRFQMHYIKQAIDRSRGNMRRAAELLGVHRSNLYRKMRQLGMGTGAEGENLD